MTDMSEVILDSFIKQHCTRLALETIHKPTEMAFRDHPQFPLLSDILGRRYNHHAILYMPFPARLLTPFLEAYLLYLNREHSLPNLRTNELIVIDLNNIQLTPYIQDQIQAYITHLLQTLDASNKFMLLVLRIDPLIFTDNKHKHNHFLRQQCDLLLAHPKCRVMIMTNNPNIHEHDIADDQFASLHLVPPTETDIIAILKLHRTELESYHHVIIPDELLAHAYHLAGRYLSTNHALENALLILDSSAARANNNEFNDQQTHIKAVLTPVHLAHVLSSWTHVPASLLQPGKFKMNEFSQGIEQRIFGQEAALSIINHELQQAIIRSRFTSAPFCAFLFAGPEHAGKKATAVAMAELMFKHTNTLYFAQLASSQVYSIADIKLQRYEDRQRLPFKEVIQQTPYAMIVFENADHASPAILDELYEILSTGYLYDDQKNPLNLHQAIIILSTTLGSQHLTSLAQSLPKEDDNAAGDFMQILMSDQQRGQQHKAQRAPHEIAQDILPEITACLPTLLCKHLHTVPFLPLDKQAAEKIIRLKLKDLGKQLEMRYKIDLGYAPEVVRYLVRETMTHNDTNNQLPRMDKALKQLQFVIEQAAVNQLDDPSRSNQLFLQLNETGRMLKWEWSTTVAATS